GLGDRVYVRRVVDPLELWARREPRLQESRVRIPERAEPLERIVHTLQAPGLERMVASVHMRRQTWVPHKAGGSAHRTRSSVTNVNANGWRASAGCVVRSTSRQSRGSSGGK